ncbi:MAG: hypothetical protein HY721_25780 [Planctomycetes bacterium]|nr:hypothetical protein [Planctomycetota bacterium]
MEVALSPIQEMRLREIAEKRGKPAEILAAEILEEAIARRGSAESGTPVPIGSVPPDRRLSNLRGLGKEIWQGEDAQAYVNRLREAEWR